MRTKTGNGRNVDLERFLEDAKVVVRDGQELLKASFGGVKDRALSGVKTTDRALREHPYQTMGMIFAVGLLAGLLLSTTFSRHAEEEFSED